MRMETERKSKEAKPSLFDDPLDKVLAELNVDLAKGLSSSDIAN